ncbi:hypothetical protein SAY86_016043 [Trapa natans]|uniref:Endoglucanase n=1 Tax=Trapa natans TaxID=22666 RepID=A0AAN7LJL1_TRANT|nr:hypothetical protein SAY86_016043 [Trapa natans]
MTTSRRAYKVDAENPGSEVAAETAAAMAAAALVFRETNPHYSQLLLHHARQLFEFGEKYRGKYDESVMAAKGYYTSVSGYGDELLWAAAWLYRATTDTSYMDFLAGSEAFSLGGVTWAISEFSWDLKFAGLQLLSSTMLDQPGLEHRHKSVLEQYRSKAEHYICACMDQNNSTSNVHRTPGGLLYTRAWNNMQYVSAAAFLLAFYSDHLRSTGRRLTCSRGVQPLGPEEILGLARSQVDYILGGNPMGMSYLVGFGRRYPRQVHHRGASTEAYRSNRGFIGCTQGYDSWFARKGPNPNVVVGALVGGPDKMDRFKDKRSNYAQTEACTYNTAALVGVLAKLCGLDGDDSSALSEPLVYSA